MTNCMSILVAHCINVPVTVTPHHYFISPFAVNIDVIAYIFLHILIEISYEIEILAIIYDLLTNKFKSLETF